MKRVMVILIFAVFILMQNTIQAQEIMPADVKKVMKQVADWQIEHFDECYSGGKKPHHQLDWTNAALYVGMVKWAEMANDDSYYQWLKKIGE